MAKKPNYDFERRERERLKNEKKAARAAEKKMSQKTTDANDLRSDHQIARTATKDE